MKRNKTMNVVEDLIKLTEQVYIEKDYLILNIRYEYAIELRRLNTPQKIIGWVNHLKSKTWVNKEHLARFIFLAFGHIGIEIDYNI